MVVVFLLSFKPCPNRYSALCQEEWILRKNTMAEPEKVDEDTLLALRNFAQVGWGGGGALPGTAQGSTPQYTVDDLLGSLDWYPQK